MELPPPHHEIEPPPPPYHTLNFNSSDPDDSVDRVGSTSWAPNTTTSATTNERASRISRMSTSTTVKAYSLRTGGEAMAREVTPLDCGSELIVQTLPPANATVDFNSPSSRAETSNVSLTTVSTSTGDGVSSSFSATTMTPTLMSYLDSSSSYDVAGLPFPAKVSPSDVEIGIVTPSGSSVSSHADFRPSFLDILPVDDVIISDILPYLPLQSLFALRGTCTRARDILTAYFRRSISLNLSLYGSKFTPLAFNVVTKDEKKLKKMFVANAKQWLTDDLLMPVIKRNPKLSVVDFSGCSTISNKSVHVLAVQVGNSLTRIVLRDCHWLSADAVISLAIKCRRLRHVDLSGCWDVADDAVETLASTNGDHLESLSLAKIYGITDKAGTTIARLCRKLTRLDLLGCWRVTDKTVKALGETCPTLRQLFISENTNVTESALAPLRRRKVEIDVPAPGVGRGGALGGGRGAMVHGMFHQRGFGIPPDFANIPPPAFMAAVGDHPVRPRFHRV